MAKKLTQNDAIIIKAGKLAAYFHTHKKGLTKFQTHLVDDLWDVLTKWDVVKDNMHEYNLDGVRRKED